LGHEGDHFTKQQKHIAESNPWYMHGVEIKEKGEMKKLKNSKVKNYAV
jgi:hypothetical protein